MSNFILKIKRAETPFYSFLNHLIKSATTIHSLSENFYRDNPELVNKKSQVVNIMERLEGEHPELNYKELLEETKLKLNQDAKLNNGLDFAVGAKPNILVMDKSLGEL